jgi:cyclopropane-fatty-acyl-phospholipid synthase
MDKTEQAVQQLLDQADVQINGSRPFDIRVHDHRFFSRALSEGMLGLGESYMDGWWDCDAIDECFYRILQADLEKEAGRSLRIILYSLRARLFNRQKKSRAYEVGEEHYDVGNDLYRRMLDSRMVYTCGYWRNAENLDQAQEAKLDLVCRKIGLEPGMTVLDIGCGWGSFAKYAAEKYGAKVTGLTVSRDQVEWGNKMAEGLPVEIKLQDYRDAEGSYDRVISIGVMEHVGWKNYRTYMDTVDRTMKDDGIAFFHTIGANTTNTSTDAWTDKYIFPNGMLPSIAYLGRAMEGLFVMEDWHNFGPDYDRTLLAWHRNFENAWPELKKDYSERFYRMWRFYLLTAAAGFRSRRNQLWQVVMTKPGRPQPDCRAL